MNKKETEDIIEEKLRRQNMIDVLNCILAIGVTLFMGYFAYMSSVLVSEKKARYRAGTHDYYDNPIKDRNEQS